VSEAGGKVLMDKARSRARAISPTAAIPRATSSGSSRQTRPPKRRLQWVLLRSRRSRVRFTRGPRPGRSDEVQAGDRLPE